MGWRQSNLSDREFLYEIQDQTGASPLIAEIVRRFEKLIDTTEPRSTDAACPICEAELLIDFTEFQYELSVRK